MSYSTRSVGVAVWPTLVLLTMALWMFQACLPSTADAASQPLALDDVSILFPVPSHAEDLQHVIAITDLSSPASDNGPASPVLKPEFFGQLLSFANGPAGAIAGTSHHIAVPAPLQKLDQWFVAGIRVDASAPGLSSQIVEQYGQAPQIRLILQPVTKADGDDLEVHDIAVHLIFDLTAGGGLPPAEAGCFPRLKPDMDLFARVVADVSALRDKLAAGDFGDKITTAALPLGVHPGLKDAKTAGAFRDALKALLEKYLISDRLAAMAIMSIPDDGPEPWMFLSFVRVPPNVIPGFPQGGFLPVKGPLLDGNQFTEALSILPSIQVLPAPQTNNLNPITCKHEATTPPSLPAADRKGVATAELFAKPRPTQARIEEVTSTVADPVKSHFFNTDCISCHTETRRVMDLLNVKSFDHVDTAVLPQETWNVRNFGWFPSFLRTGHVEATATRRTANETQAVLDFINQMPPAKQ